MLGLRWLARVLLCGALGVLAACGGEGSDPPAAEAAASSVPGDPAASEQGRPDCPPPEAVAFEGIPDCEYPEVVFDNDADPGDRMAGLADVAGRQGHDETVAALADGKVTVAERRQAYQDALDCMTAQGMVVEQFEDYEGLFGTEFTFLAAWGTLSEADALRVSTECENRYTLLPGRAYDIQHGNRFTERTKAVLKACLERYGSTDGVGDTLDEFLEVVPSAEAERTCLSEAQRTPPVPGSPSDLQGE